MRAGAEGIFRNMGGREAAFFLFKWRRSLGTRVGIGEIRHKVGYV